MITESAAPLLLATGWLLLPGLLVGALLGLRGWLLPAVAPALTMGFVGAVGILFAAGGIAWAPGPVVLALVGLVVIRVVVFGVGAFRVGAFRPRNAHERHSRHIGSDESAVRAQGRGGAGAWRWWHHAGVGATLLVGGGLGVRTTSLATGGFTGVNQTWDALFHAGAIRLIAENGDPRPASLAAIGAQASTHFYMPDAYHCVGALVYRLSGAPIPVVINVLAATLPLLLGLGLVGLLRVVTGRPAHAVCAAFFSAVVAAVPYHLVGYGTLLPYATALVMLPGVLALVVVVLREPGWRVGAALGLAAAGLLHAHPQVAFLAAMVAILQLGRHVLDARRFGLRLLGALGVSAVVAGVLGAPVLVALVSALGRAEGIDWPVYATPAGALGDLLLFSATGSRPQWWLVPLLFAGLVAVVAREDVAALRPFVAAAGVIAGLYVLAGAYDTPLSLRLTSLWWNDRNRLAGAFAVLAIAFAAVGAVWLRDRAVAALPARPGLLGRVGPAIVLVAGLVGFSVVTEGGYAVPTRAALEVGYGDAPVLSDVEREGLAAVDETVRAGGGGMVMNDPHDGCGWGYALYGTKMVFPTPLTGPFDWADLGYDRMRLHEGFDRIDTDPQILADSERLGIRWAVLCSGFIRTWQTRAPGLYDVGALPTAHLVYADREVRLFRIDAPTSAEPR